jgi:hypothetical protein
LRMDTDFQFLLLAAPTALWAAVEFC